VSEALREIRRYLLEADVSLEVTRGFVEQEVNRLLEQFQQIRKFLQRM